MKKQRTYRVRGDGDTKYFGMAREEAEKWANYLKKVRPDMRIEIECEQP